MRKLEFLVPHYDERPDEMTPLLDSIALQQGIDLSEVGVIIAYDGPEAVALPEEEWSERYPFQIEYVHAPKGGVSATRNAALRAATAPFVQYSDADDMLFDMCGLYVVMREIDNGGFDVLLSVFREETKDADGNLTYILHDLSDRVFVHGRVLRREYLLDNDILFSEDLLIHEDSYFVIRAVELADPDRVKLCPQPFVLWKWRDNSVARHDPDYLFKTMPNMLLSSDHLVDDFVRRMMPDKANVYAAAMILSAYYTLNKPSWLEKTRADYREATERKVAEFYRKHASKWESLTPQEKTMISNGIRQRSVMEGMLLEALTVDQWLEHILSDYPDDSDSAA